MKTLVHSTKKKTILKHAQRKAKALQKDYVSLEAPSTQNVRNAFPMWAIVQAALLPAPLPTSTVDAVLQMSANINGKRIVKNTTRKVPILYVVGKDFYAPLGKSVNELLSLIRNHGFMATRANVASALKTLMRQGLVFRLPFSSKSNYKYFLQES